MRHVGPEAHRGQVPIAAERVQHAHDPGRALVARGAQAEPAGQLRIRGAADQPHGLRVRDLGEQGAQGHDERHVAHPRQLEHGVAVRPPPQVRLGSDAHDEIAREIGRLGDRELRDRPDHLPLRLGAGLEAHVRAGQPEVVELLRVDLRELLPGERCGQVARRRRRRLRRVVPAGERQQHDGPAEGRGHRVDFQWVHRRRKPPGGLLSLAESTTFDAGGPPRRPAARIPKDLTGADRTK